MAEIGILLIDKPVGISSFDVIRKLRQITKIRKMGHTGTLDPFASGLLPICVGKATRIADKLSGNEKEYLVKMKFGIKTDSGDITGKIIDSQTELKVENPANIVKQILAIEEQTPPIFSAIKIDGKRAYEYARKGENIKLKSRPIKIHNFKIIEFNFPFLTYKTTVSKGTYIRVLSETIADLLDTIATTVELQRTKIGNLNLENGVKLAQLNPQNWQDNLFDITEILTDFPKISIDKIDDFVNGKRTFIEQDNIEEIMVICENKFVGFAKIENGYLCPTKVMVN
ncbi:MAG: tRNA pseudouridine(55) synthase TruB [Candidatus Cloacimonetes bacterium]|jgi:tRNA pseudouridine55 synthase|nr:tRNA pseudouridine(55) synthase TruB [Candidatus Cloacimonadota bacterium]MBT6993326.1 tRNA pseudouridine(55) synthase TruB [Candidatus Cloacimonadota bacterium]MBT7469750.1 tRNA pseudouridine(55) synthase TruB [Candidatus Cloacimonadota bacterium]